MLCDELNTYNFEPIDLVFYEKSEVDAAIAELKDCKDEWAKQCSRLTAENMELKQKLHDADMRADLAEAANTEYREDFKKMEAAFNEMFDNYIKSQRALWIARSNRALSQYAWHMQTAETLLRGGTSAAVDYQKWKAKLWKNVELICHKKADEFKECV